MSETNNDLTIVYYTADHIPEPFAQSIRDNLILSSTKYHVILIHQDKKLERSHLNIYRQALLGAKMATTKYIALAEDDVLYHEEHFTHRPSPGVFAYNKSLWSIYTWVKPPIFSYKDRRNLSTLICERDLFIEAMEERFAKYPDDSKVNLSNWSEPGKYEDHLGVTRRQSEVFYTNIPLVAFSHETALSFTNLGKRKKLGDLRVTGLPHWGMAEDVIKLYE